MVKRKAQSLAARYAKRRRFTRKRRIVRKNAHKRIGGTQLSLRRNPWPKFQKATLRYVEDNVALNPAVGAAANYFFNWLGLYDCNYTGAGHQPMGYDEYMSIYHHYTVIGAKCTAYFKNTDTNSEQFAGVSLTATPDAKIVPTQLMENGMGKWVHLGPSGEGAEMGSVTVPVSTKRFFAHRSIMTGSQFKGSTSANPAEDAYFLIWAGPNKTSVDAGAVNVTVVLEFVVVFHEPRYLSQS